MIQELNFSHTLAFFVSEKLFSNLERIYKLAENLKKYHKNKVQTAALV
jgi:hypothetical protein